MYVQCCSDCRPGRLAVVVSVCTVSGCETLGVCVSVFRVVCLAVLLAVCTMLARVLWSVVLAELQCVLLAVFLSVFLCVFPLVCTSYCLMYVGVYFGLYASVYSGVYVQRNLLASRCVLSSVVYCVCTSSPVIPSPRITPRLSAHLVETTPAMTHLASSTPATLRPSHALPWSSPPLDPQTPWKPLQPSLNQPEPDTLPIHPKAHLSTNVLPTRRPPKSWLGFARFFLGRSAETGPPAILQSKATASQAHGPEFMPSAA